MRNTQTRNFEADADTLNALLSKAKQNSATMMRWPYQSALRRWSYMPANTK